MDKTQTIATLIEFCCLLFSGNKMISQADYFLPNTILITMLLSQSNNLMLVHLGSKEPAETSGRRCVNVLETSINHQYQPVHKL